MTAWQIALSQLNKAKKPKTSGCRYCGADFTINPRHPNKLYCDPVCARKARYLKL